MSLKKNNKFVNIDMQLDIIYRKKSTSQLPILHSTLKSEQLINATDVL